MNRLGSTYRHIFFPAGTEPAACDGKPMTPGVLLLGLLALVLPHGALLADDFPDGCVSCHVVLDDGADKRLTAVLDEIGHVALKGKVARAPADCIGCHEKKSDTPFSILIHQAHFDKPDTNVFVQRFGGDCRTCHAMDGSTGEAKLKQGEANW